MEIIEYFEEEFNENEKYKLLDFMTRFGILPEYIVIKLISNSDVDLDKLTEYNECLTSIVLRHFPNS